MEVYCCCCGKKKITKELWIETEEEQPFPVSHGYCPVCVKIAREQLKRNKK